MSQPDDLCVSHVPIFAKLSYDEQLEVAGSARPKQLLAGEAVYLQGGKPSPMIILHTGTVKLTRINQDGKERVIQILEPGDFAGEASLFAGTRPDHSAISVTASSACMFTRESFARLLAEHPGVAMGMIATLSRRLSDSQNLIDNVTTREVGSRVADYLLGLEAKPSLSGVQVQLPAAKKDVASLLGTTPESFSRALSKLVEQDLVQLVDARTISLTDIDRLSELAQ